MFIIAYGSIKQQIFWCNYTYKITKSIKFIFLKIKGILLKTYTGSFMKKIVIIPAYNEHKNIVNVVNDIKMNAPDFDYIIINDGSTDDTISLCIRNNFNVINLPFNLGIGACVQTGYIYAVENGYDIAVQFDGDGQHKAKYLKNMYEKMLKTQSDMIIGSRYLNKDGYQSTVLRRMGIRFLSKLIKILHKQDIKDVTSGLRMVNNNLIAIFSEYYPYDYPEPETIAFCIRKKLKITEVPVLMEPRTEGNSSIGNIQSLYYMLKVSFSIIVDYFKN